MIKISAQPAGPLTGSSSYLSYTEVLWLQHEEDIGEYFPEAIPGAWNVVVDTCYLAPYMSKKLLFIVI